VVEIDGPVLPVNLRVVIIVKYFCINTSTILVTRIMYSLRVAQGRERSVSGLASKQQDNLLAVNGTRPRDGQGVFVHQSRTRASCEQGKVSEQSCIETVILRTS
jgi:hypothetical protein